MNTQQFTSEVIIPKTHKVVVYFVNESELDSLERGSRSSLYLTIGLSLLSIFFSFVIVLLSTPITSNRVFDVFVIIASVTFISGIVLLLLWRKADDEIGIIIQNIKERFPEGEQSESTGRYNVEFNTQRTDLETEE